ncbi:unnamed protein product [Blepharisma stoltei]|uniref:PPM-type phosphatase domain-containing protein n=1 Tax=Blepharisma stoltei TaxID=1481888 RepID=A0AAU9IYS3_9CILI|nr:unnamed protein product [Blepharisma stoltei]
MGCQCTRDYPPDELDNIRYERYARLHVKEIRGAREIISNLYIELLPPMSELFFSDTDGGMRYKISGCCISGQDPHNFFIQKCKDSFFVAQTPESLTLIFGIFDGHGTEGSKVVEFCKAYMERFIIENENMFRNRRKEALETMFISCDEKLADTDIDCTMSGTTALMLIIDPKEISVATIGKNKAILATIPEIRKEVSSLVLSAENRPMQKILTPVTLSADHKPSNPEEFKRISKAGGIVKKLVDSDGKSIGPSRVFLKGANIPGLAVSRSIGDILGHRVGVIPDPIYSNFYYNKATDKFIVAASDGIWQVMDDIEVINFVDRYKKYCKKHKGNGEYPARPSNSTIARLLCEEARRKWLLEVEKNDVIIDDISCVIVEYAGLKTNYMTSNDEKIEEHTESFNETEVEPISINPDVNFITSSMIYIEEGLELSDIYNTIASYNSK